MKKKHRIDWGSHGIGLENVKIPAPDHQVITASRISDNLKVAEEFAPAIMVNVIAPSLTGGSSTLNIT